MKKVITVIKNSVASTLKASTGRLPYQPDQPPAPGNKKQTMMMPGMPLPSKKKQTMMMPGMPPPSNNKKQTVMIPGISQQQDSGKMWVVWLAVVGFVVIIITICAAGGSRRPVYYSPPPGPVAQPTKQQQRREERLWMGKYMKDHGTVNNADLKARQERVRRTRDSVEF